jgi:hypothetical protein
MSTDYVKHWHCPRKVAVTSFSWVLKPGKKKLALKEESPRLQAGG